LEQVEMGIGEKFGQCIIVFFFMTSWKLTLVWLCIAPFIIVAVLFLVNALKTGIILERKHGKKQEV
jgi:ABC-type bacteriocin/lantibiotic exporter with double-glycine peptidase domain